MPSGGGGLGFILEEWDRQRELDLAKSILIDIPPGVAKLIEQYPAFKKEILIEWERRKRERRRREDELLMLLE